MSLVKIYQYNVNICKMYFIFSKNLFLLKKKKNMIEYFCGFIKEVSFMKKVLSVLFLLSVITFSSPAFAGTHGTNGHVSAKSIGAGALSLLIWPGIGQAINNQSYDKNVTHAVLGLTGIFRIWSCYDAVVDRQGGVWKNRI